MLFLGNGLRSAAVVAAVALAAPVLADAPVMRLHVNGTSSDGTMTPKEELLAPNSTSSSGVGSYFGTVVGTNGTNPIWNCSYNFSAASGADFATQSGSISLTNTSGQDLAFAMTLALPVAAMGSNPGLFNGSVAAALITGSASSGVGTMSPNGEFPLWVARSGGVQVASLLNNWASVSRTAPGASLIGSASFGGSTPSVPAGSFGDPLSVTFYFVLSNNATASFTTSFGGVAIPAPGAFALLATAGLVTRRRRR